jgi:hypothetical protein
MTAYINGCMTAYVNKLGRLRLGPGPPILTLPGFACSRTPVIVGHRLLSESSSSRPEKAQSSINHLALSAPGILEKVEPDSFEPFACKLSKSLLS